MGCFLESVAAWRTPDEMTPPVEWIIPFRVNTAPRPFEGSEPRDACGSVVRCRACGGRGFIYGQANPDDVDGACYAEDCPPCGGIGALALPLPVALAASPHGYFVYGDAESDERIPLHLERSLRCVTPRV